MIRVEIISPSTEALDRNQKSVDYAAHGVSEYWIVDPEAKTVEQYINEDNTFQLVSKFSKGSISCSVIEGLEIRLEEIF